MSTSTRRTARRLLSKAIDHEHALRDVCRPRGSHRRTDELETYTVGGRPCPMERCADCSTWAPVDGSGGLPWAPR